MNTKSPQLLSPLASLYDCFREQFNQFTREASHLHESLILEGETSREAFSALSRIMGFSDQMELILSLIREDVRIFEELSSGSAESLWPEHFGDSFRQWLGTSRSAALKVN